MAIGPRKRFEIFKRDGFQCRYCGKRTPEVVLEVDHVIPVCEGGSDDEMNLVTACWACNSGKSGIQLQEVITGEDPHDRAILLLERERQLREYNHVLEAVRDRTESELQDVLGYWERTVSPRGLSKQDEVWIRRTLETCPVERILQAIDVAAASGKVSGLAYVAAVIRNWREEGKL